jgi:Domain of unknown function (DUF4407)
MSAHKLAEPHVSGSSVEALLTWLGGGERHELDQRHERSAHAVAGVVVVLDATLAWLVTTLVVFEATRWPLLAIMPFTLVFGLLVAAIIRGVASGPIRGGRGVLGRALLAAAVGIVVGECAALALFSGSVDHRLEQDAARSAASAPAVVQSSTSLARLREARVALDHAVDSARTHRDEALVVARCEYHPTPTCPQTQITGVPGSGPETRTANQLLADSQRELDTAVATRDRQAAELDPQIRDDELALSGARQSAIANADHGLGARWLAMHELTLASAGSFLLRLLTIAVFTLLSLVPLILRLWRGETAHDRHAEARAERERAELEAETAIAVKRAEVRAAAETMWAEQQLAKARMAVEAQTEIDRAQLRQRVSAALESAKAADEPEAPDIYLPIAAEAEAASLVATQLPCIEEETEVTETPNLPATVESGDVPATPQIPSLPDVTKAAARWIRPLVPSFVARAIDNSTHPLRTARQVLEEVEEITFSLKRTRRITVNTEESVAPESAGESGSFGASDAAHGLQHIAAQRATPQRLAEKRVEGVALPQRESQHELAERKGPREVRAAEGPPQLPPAG